MTLSNIRYDAFRALYMLGIVCLALYSPLSRAAWEVIPTLDFGAFVEDNPRYEPRSQATSDSGLFWQGSLGITNISERGSFTVEPRVDSLRYGSNANTDLDSNDIFLLSTGERRWQTGEVGYTLNASREIVRRAEFAGVEGDIDPDALDPIATDGGLVTFLDQDRDYLSVRPYLQFDLSSQNYLRFDVTNLDVSYSSTNLDQRTGFDTSILSATFGRRSTERNRLSATIRTANYSAVVNDNDTDTVTLLGTLTRSVNPLWTLDLTAGVGQNDIAFTSNGQRITRTGVSDYTMLVRLRKRSEVSRFNIDLSHRSNPSSSGFVNERSELRVYFEQDLKPRLSGTVGARLLRDRSSGDVQSTSDRNYHRFEASIDWAMKRRLFLNAGYQYFRQKFVNEPGGESRTSQFIYIGMTYRGLSQFQ